MAHKQQPQWQPISVLPMIASLIDGMLHDDEEHYRTLLQAKDRPYVPDDALVARVIRVYAEQLEDRALFEEQLSRWAQEPLTVAEKQEVERLGTQVKKLGDVLQGILSLVEELKQGTIEQVLNKQE